MSNATRKKSLRTWLSTGSKAPSQIQATNVEPEWGQIFLRLASSAGQYRDREYENCYEMRQLGDEEQEEVFFDDTEEEGVFQENLWMEEIAAEELKACAYFEPSTSSLPSRLPSFESSSPFSNRVKRHKKTPATTNSKQERRRTRLTPKRPKKARIECESGEQWHAGGKMTMEVWQDWSAT